MMDEVLMHMGIRKAARRDYCEMNCWSSWLQREKKKGKYIQFKRGKGYKEELRTQKDEFMPYSLK